MPSNDKQYYIYLRSTKERVPCTKEEFYNFTIVTSMLSAGRCNVMADVSTRKVNG